MRKLTLRNIYNILLSVLVIFTIALRQNTFLGQRILGSDKEIKTDISVEQARNFFNNAYSVKKYSKWFEVYDESGKNIGYLLHSEHFSPQVKGYNGKVPLIVALNKEKTITQIEMLPNRETGDFVEIISGKSYLSTWVNISLTKAATLKVDAISGATATSEAIKNNVKFALLGFASEIDNFSYQDYKIVNKKNIVKHGVFFIFLLLALFAFFYPSRTKKYRILILGASVLVMGFWLTEMLSIDKFYHWIINGFDFKKQLVLIILLVLIIILPLITRKNFYCNYVCPFGSMQELMGKVPLFKVRIPKFIYSNENQIKRWVFIVILIFLVIDWKIDLSKIEPFAAFSYKIVSSFTLALASAFIILSLLIKRPWCKFFCPTGYVIRLFNTRNMKKLQFSEIINLLLIAIIIILIIRPVATINSSSGKTVSKQNYVTEENNPESSSEKFVALNDSVYQLPSPSYDSRISLEYSLTNRRSRRYYMDKALNIKQVAQVLWAAYGVTQSQNVPGHIKGGLKTAPSAGGRYPLEIYLLAGNISDMPVGLYKYLPNEHHLVKINNKDLRPELVKASLNQYMLQEAPAVLIYSAVAERTTSLYNERGKEKYIPMEVGHSAQNVYLQTTALGMGTCAVGAFEDEKVKQLLNLPTNEEPMMIMPFGNYKLKN